MGDGHADDFYVVSRAPSCKGLIDRRRELEHRLNSLKQRAKLRSNTKNLTQHQDDIAWCEMALYALDAHILSVEKRLTTLHKITVCLEDDEVQSRDTTAPTDRTGQRSDDTPCAANAIETNDDSSPPHCEHCEQYVDAATESTHYADEQFHLNQVVLTQAATTDKWYFTKNIQIHRRCPRLCGPLLYDVKHVDDDIETNVPRCRIKESDY